MGGRRKDGRPSRSLDVDGERFDRQWVRKPTPMDIPDSVLRQTGRERECEPVPVRAFVPVHYAYDDLLEVEGEVVAWTDSAVLVRAVLIPGHAPQHVWVWANAVQRKLPPAQPGDAR